ncbi:MAG: hypothetical protein BWK80_04775, partial [Desulfobacteraceae bacterium IS3]
DNFIKNELIEIRKLWLNEKKVGGIKLIYNDKKLSPEETTNYWINGFYFHNDMNKMSLLNNLLCHEKIILRAIFLDHLIQATKYVFAVGDILKKVLNENMFLE